MNLENFDFSINALNLPSDMYMYRVTYLPDLHNFQACAYVSVCVCVSVCVYVVVCMFVACIICIYTCTVETQ